ncbi:histone-lysine N-methyltransferase SUV39H1 isoform X2 [Patagioenas fasciata]|uniref:histone-lysine N-methyltransferase SUV39H1 isoform X2 n=1 Tax=Patagioenas fasciata TaxID=372321 RepID=UPI003A995E44
MAENLKGCSVCCLSSRWRLQQLCRLERLRCRALGVTRRNLGDFEVEFLCDYKRVRDEDFYLVKWRGYPRAASTWEPRRNLRCRGLLRQLHQDLARAPGGPARPGPRGLPPRAAAFLVQKAEQRRALRRWERLLNSTRGHRGRIVVENEVDLHGPPRDFVYINEYKVRVQRGGAGADPRRAAHLRVQLALPLRRRLPQPRGAARHLLRPLHLPHRRRPRLGRAHAAAHPQEQLRHGVRGGDHHIGGGGAARAGVRPARGHVLVRPGLRGGRVHRGRRALRQHLTLRQPQLRPQPAGVQRVHREPGPATAAHRAVRHAAHPRRGGAHLRLQHARGPGGCREHPHGLQLRAGGGGPGGLPPCPQPHRVQVRGGRLPQVPVLSHKHACYRSRCVHGEGVGGVTRAGGATR